MRSPKIALVLACAVYLVHRALVLHTNFDSVCVPNYELSAMGNIGWILETGWRGVPLSQYYDNCGGHLVVGLMAAPLNAVFGPSYLTLKLIPVLLGLACIPLLGSIGKRLFGPWAGVLAAWLFVLGPPTLTKYSMLAKGNHFENLFFQLLLLWVFVRMHQSPRKERWLPAFGFVAGFSIFFYFGSGLMVAILAALHFAIRFEWRLSPSALARPLRDGAIALVPFLVGLLPLYLIQASNQRPTQFMNVWFFDEPTQKGFVAQSKELFTDLLPRAAVHEDLWFIPGSLADKVIFGLFLAVWLIAMILLIGRLPGLFASSKMTAADAERDRFQRLRFFPLVAYLPALALVYGYSALDFDVYGPPVEVGQFRYLVPHFTFAALLIGGAVVCLHETRWLLWRGLAGGLTAVALALGLFVIPLVDWSFDRTGLGSRYPGYSLLEYRNALMRGSFVDPETGLVTWDFDVVKGNIDDFSIAEQQGIVRGVGDYLAWGQSLGGYIDGKLVTPSGFNLDTLLKPFPEPELAPDVARGGGTFLRRAMAEPAQAAAPLRAKLDALLASEHPMAGYVVEGLSLDSEYPLVRMSEAQLGRSSIMGAAVPEAFVPAWRRGQGLQIGDLMRRGQRPDLEFARGVIGSIPAEHAAEFWAGVGIGLTFEDDVPTAGAEWAPLVPEAHQSALWQGVGAGLRHGHGEDAASTLADELATTLSPESAAALAQGREWPNYPAPYVLSGS